jgi:hypothetical protein
MIQYLHLVEDKQKEEEDEAQLERELFVNNYELWYSLYGEKEDDEGIMFRPETDEEVEEMVAMWEASGWKSGRS